MLAKSISGAAAAASPAYIEDVFSTYLYTGTGATQTITNGIDLSGKGGLVWIKGRSGATGHRFTDTARGATKSLTSSTTGTAAEVTESTGLTAFGSTGFTIGADADYNTSTATYVSWAFRKQAKFFDVVTYTGNGTTQNIAHNLGSVPGCIIVKRTDSAGNWAVYHTSLGNASALYLQSTTSVVGGSFWNSTNPTSTQFTVGSISTTNASGGTFVAYLFAHDAGGFGLTGTDNVISCGSYTGNGSATGPVINLGYEPQWLLVKRSDDTGTWYLVDNMRGFTVSGSDQILEVNGSGVDYTGTVISVNSTGFQLATTNIAYNASGGTYIYIAIRRGPMKVPTSGTSVFTPVTRTGTGANTTTTAGFHVDMGITGRRNAVSSKFGVVYRLGSSKYLLTTVYDSEAESSSAYQTNPFDDQTALKIGTFSAITNASGNTYVDYLFKRSPGFLDVVCYTGTGANRTVNHNLAVAPELMIVKRRDFVGDWLVYDAITGNTKYQVLNSTATPVTSTAAWNNTTPSATTFTLGTDAYVNANGGTYVAYLFATVTGVSKVGSYTGTGTTKQIDCGFTGGARFVLIKRTNSTGDWYVWDSARGIVSGNDPYLLLNSTAAEVTSTDYIDTYSAGFEISSTAPAAINANGGTFIFLAIA